MSESKWKQIVGKKISEGAYINSESLRVDYTKVMPTTCLVLGNDSERVKQLEDKAQSLQRQLTFTQEQLDMKNAEDVHYESNLLDRVYDLEREIQKLKVQKLRG